jgi:hypothetical protein
MVGLYAGFIYLALSGQLWWPPSGFQELLVQCSGRMLPH